PFTGRPEFSVLAMPHDGHFEFTVDSPAMYRVEATYGWSHENQIHHITDVQVPEGGASNLALDVPLGRADLIIDLAGVDRARMRFARAFLFTGPAHLEPNGTPAFTPGTYREMTLREGATELY